MVWDVVQFLLNAIVPLSLAADLSSAPAFPPAPVEFKAQDRTVSNWRWQAANALDLPVENALTLLLGRDLRGLSRCVRLNNYWCVKGTGWRGMLTADAEGHVAFSSAQEGADVAANLLRRYYLNFGRRTALQIVSRWAPAQCSASTLTATAKARTKPRAAARVAKAGPDAFATHGLANTLRARWLAGGRRPIRLAIKQPSPAFKMLPAPSIMAGVTEIPIHDVKLAPVQLSSLVPPENDTLKPMPLPSAPAMSGCASETLRIRNYAQRAILGLASSINDDLHLFSDEGKPTPALQRLMMNMAAVEIGPLRIDEALVRKAVSNMEGSIKVEEKK